MPEEFLYPSFEFIKGHALDHIAVGVRQAGVVLIAVISGKNNDRQ